MNAGEPFSASAEDALSSSEAALTLRVLSAVEVNNVVTQRSLARELGIALGLANAYLRRCAQKGLIKVAHIPARRYAYYLTPQGLAEKSRLTAEYLTQSLAFFRFAREQCEAAFEECEKSRWRRVVLCGEGDIAEIALLCSHAFRVELAGVVDPAAAVSRTRLPVFRTLDAAGRIEAALVTDHRTPQATYDRVAGEIDPARILTLPLLNISRPERRAEG